MLSNLFRQDGALWKILNFLTDVFTLSTLWLIFCLPIITAGSATTALYDSIAHCVRFKKPGPYKKFFRTFRTELKISLLTELLWGTIIFLGMMALSFLREKGGASDVAILYSAAYYIIMLIPIGAFCWTFPILSRFTYSFGTLNITALKIAFGYLPRTVIMVILTLETINLCVNYFFPVFFAPALMMLLWTLFVEPVFAKHGGGIKKEKSET